MESVPSIHVVSPFSWWHQLQPGCDVLFCDIT